MSGSGASGDRFINVVARGIIRRVTEGTIQTLQVDHGPMLNGKSLQVRNGLAHAGEYGFYSVPLPGMSCVSVYVGGDKSNGASVGIFDTARPVDGDPGESGLYNRVTGQRVRLAGAGLVVDAAGLPVTIVNAGVVRLECSSLQVTGDVVDNCDSNTHTVKELRDTYNAHKHKDTKPEPGSFSGITDTTLV